MQEKVLDKNFDSAMALSLVGRSLNPSRHGCLCSSLCLSLCCKFLTCTTLCAMKLKHSLTAKNKVCEATLQRNRQETYTRFHVK